MLSKKYFIFFFLILTFSGFLITSIEDSNQANVTLCNICHGPSAIGHVDYSVALIVAGTVQNGVSTTVTATVFNNAFPLSASSITIASSSDFSVTKGPISQSLGYLDRKSTTVAKWDILFHVQSDKTSTVKVSFQGTAIDHKTHTFTSDSSKTIYVSTIPRPILQVHSNPISETSIYAGSSNNSGQLTISNVGQATMNNIHIKATGLILVDSKNQTDIPQLLEGQSISLPISIDTSKPGSGTIQIEYDGDIIQRTIITISITPNPADSFTLFLGRIFGYLTFFFLFLSVFTGAGIFYLKKYISGRKIRILHSDLANLSFTMVIIHAMILTIPNSPWSDVFKFFELFPERIPLTSQALGLFLGRSGLVLMYISVFSGFYISKLIKRFGRSVGISIHMLSYVALVLGLFHVALMGGIAKSYPVILLIMFISVISIGFLKYETKRTIAARREERARKRKLYLNKDDSYPNVVEQNS